MSDIYVFSRNDVDNDYSSFGLVGALVPTQAVFKEEGNGESILEMSHPLDTWEKYRGLEKENIIVAKVPVRNVPEIQNGTQVSVVWEYKVKNLSSKMRTLYKNAKKNKAVKKNIPKDTPVTVVWKNINDQNARYKVKCKYGTGYMYPNVLDEVKTVYLDEEDLEYEEATPSWSTQPQQFRIFEVKKSMDSIEVKARHISYDMLYSIVYYANGNKIPLTTLMPGFHGGIADSNIRERFNFYTDCDTEQAGNKFDHKNVIDGLIAPDEGICDRFKVKLVRDNYDLYLLASPGIDRGIVLEYGKNLTSIEYTDSNDELITRILPVGKQKNDLPLYLDTGIGGIQRTLQQGHTGSDVYLLKSLLNRGGYNKTGSWSKGKWKTGKKIKKFSVNNSFDAPTKTSVNTLHRKKKRTETGTITPAQFEELKSDVGLKDNNMFIDSSDISKYSVVYMSYLDCSSCKVGDKDPAGAKYTVASARAAMRELALDEFEKECDKPKIEATVEFVNLGDTEEYAFLKDLELCYLYDEVTIRNNNIGIDIRAEVQSITWDCILDRMQSMEIGNIHNNVAKDSVPSWRLSDVEAAKIVGQISTENVDASMAYTVVVTSTSGDEIPAEQSQSDPGQTLNARVFSGVEEFTDNFPPAAFTWYKNGNVYPDSTNCHAKSVNVTYASLSGASARFVCEIDASMYSTPGFRYYLSTGENTFIEVDGQEWNVMLPETTEDLPYIWESETYEYSDGSFELNTDGGTYPRRYIEEGE